MKKHEQDKLRILFYGQPELEVKGLEQLVWDRLDLSLDAPDPHISLLLRILYYAVKDRDHEFVNTTGQRLCEVLKLHWPTVLKSFRLYWGEEVYDG